MQTQRHSARRLRSRAQHAGALALLLGPTILPLLLPLPARGDEAPTLEDLMREIQTLRHQVEEQQREIDELKRAHEGPAEASAADPSSHTPMPVVVAPDHDPEPAREVAETEPEADSAAGESGAEEPESKPRVTAGWDGHFYLADAEDRFRLSLWAYSQFRYTYNHREEPPPGEPKNEHGFTVPRTRIFLEGRFADRFDFQIRTNIDAVGNFDLINAWAQVRLPKGWSIRGGELFPAISREDWMYPRDLLTSEFSANNSEYAIGTAMGIQAFREQAHHRYWFAFTNGSLGGRCEALDCNAADWAVSGRYEYQLGEDWSVWDDLIGRRGRSRGVLFGLGTLVQGRANASFPATAPKFGATITTDLSFNGDGYQTMAAFTWQHIEPDARSGAYNNYGLHVQGGYFVTRPLQLYGYYDGVYPGDQPGDLDPYHVLGAGVNYIPFDWTNLYKASLEAGYLFTDMSKTIVSPSSTLGYLPSAGPGQFLLRAQLQFGF